MQISFENMYVPYLRWREMVKWEVVCVQEWRHLEGVPHLSESLSDTGRQLKKSEAFRFVRWIGVVDCGGVLHRVHDQ